MLKVVEEITNAQSCFTLTVLILSLFILQGYYIVIIYSTKVRIIFVEFMHRIYIYVTVKSVYYYHHNIIGLAASDKL